MKKELNKRWFSNSQNIIAIGVTLIGVCALIVSIMQTRIMSEQRTLMYKQAKAEAWPRLDIASTMSFGSISRKIEGYSLGIGNAGVGPAIIKHVRVTYKGVVVKNWKDLFENFQVPDSIKKNYDYSTIGKRILKIGQDVIFLDLKSNLPLAQAFYENSNEIEFEIIYESIYGDKWLLTSNLNEKTIVEAIPYNVIPNNVIPTQEEFED
jgi:hypothetical protein